MRQGFSLIELLVVLAILGLLASAVLVGFGGGRRQARDDRRVADLRQVQQFLQLYYLKCGTYPGNYHPGTNTCGGGLVPNIGSQNPNNWSELQTALRNAKIGVESIPNNPAGNYVYKVQLELGSPNPTPKAQCYLLMAQMETDHKALGKDLDFQDLIAKLLPLPPGCSDITCKNLHPPTLPGFCGAGVGEREYCVGNIQCFYGG